MTNSNNNNGFYIPKEFKPNIPETATVSYYYPEEEVKVVPLIQDGAYYSWKANEDYASYGPGEKWCSKCQNNKTVANDSDKYCPGCGQAFGTVAITSTQQRHESNNDRVDKNKSGTSTYECTTNKDGTFTEKVSYSK